MGELERFRRDRPMVQELLCLRKSPVFKNKKSRCQLVSVF